MSIRCPNCTNEVLSAVCPLPGSVYICWQCNQKFAELSASSAEGQASLWEGFDERRDGKQQGTPKDDQVS